MHLLVWRSARPHVVFAKSALGWGVSALETAAYHSDDEFSAHPIPARDRDQSGCNNVAEPYGLS